MARATGVALAAWVALSPPHVLAARDQTGEETLLDAYARARLAEADGALLTAAGAYREAVALDPANVEIVRRGFRQAVLAGDKALALKSAHGLDVAGQLPRDGTVLLLVDALDHRKWDEARTLIDRVEAEENLAFIVPFMRSWVALADGPYDPPVIAVDQAYAVFAVRYQEEQLLMQRLALGDAAGAQEAYAWVKRNETALGAQERAAMAARFAQLGRRDIALELLSDSAAGGGSPAELLDQAEKRYRKQRFSPQAGLAMLMHRLALDLFGQGEGTATLSIARMASFADPANEDVRLNVARAALAARYPEVAYAEAGAIPPTSGAWMAAQGVRLRALLDQSRDAEAVSQARQLVQDRFDPQRQRLLGDILMQTGDYAGAAQAYDAARQGMGKLEDPALLLQLGGAFEQAGQWKAARPILEKVVQLAPDSAPALNHLG